MKRAILATVLTAAFTASGPLIAVAQDGAATLTVRNSEEHGPYMADGDGRSLYLFEADTQGKGDAEAMSTCYDACAEAWPPLIAESPQAGEQARPELVDTVERRDGQTQVTYAGWPLYYYAQDQDPGDTKGHDIEDHGAEWYLLTPVGDKAGE